MIEFSSLEDLQGNVEGIRSGSWNTVKNIEKNCSLNCLFGSCIMSTENQMKCVCKNGYTGKNFFIKLSFTDFFST